MNSENIDVMTEDEKQEMREKLEEFSSLDEVSMEHEHELDVSEEDVNIHFFPKGNEGVGESGEIASIFFEVSVDSSAEWYEDNLGAYSMDNLRNGGPIYQALSRELENIVSDVLDIRNPSFIMEKGSGAFTADFEV